MKIVHRIILAVAISLITRLSEAQVLPCDSVIGNACRSIVTDTVFNPYVTGVLGNWRANKSYTYFAKRAETDPTTATNIRRDGTFQDFATFWNFQQAALKPQYDTTRWVWNSEITLFNRKGFEIENKDPLGRYNAGLYGYNLTMPIAVVQNSRYRESAFEGFEDYGFVTQGCGTNCAASRHIDFSSHVASMVTTEKHSGKSSLRLAASQQAGVAVVLVPASRDTIVPTLNYTLKQSECAGSALDNIKTSNKVLLPNFAPAPGQRMVVSAWVKEEQDCKCASYTNNQIVVVVKKTSGPNDNFVFTPSGSIIEGWQRYEGVFDLPANADSMTISMRAIGSTTVYFDDLRIHPFNANMKSFVFHPVNLRLMAELDENNYATFYEYDDDGTLARLKKETQRGIKTIKETRSALVKQ